MSARALCSILAMAGFALGQDVEVAEQRARYEQARLDLCGRNLQAIAWAAYRTPDDAPLGRELGVALRTVLDQRGAKLPAGAWQRTAGAVLDALIRTESSLSAGDLAPWFDVRPHEAIVLASRDVSRHAGMLLRMLEDRRPQVAWVAACNLLLAERPELLVPKLLEQCRVRLRVFVVEADSFAASGWSSSISCCGGGGRSKVVGFPPRVAYRLIFGSHEDGRIAPGPSNVRHVREEVVRWRAAASCRSDIDRVDYGFRCLQRLAGPSGDRARLASDVQENVTWSTARQVRQEVGDIAAALRRDYRALLLRLSRRRLVSPAAVLAAHLPIELELSDCRDEGRRQAALPRIQLSRPR